MKKLWTVCILLALAASAAFAGYQKEDVKADGSVEVTLEKALAYYEEGLPLTDAMKAMVTEYFGTLPEEGGYDGLDAVGGPDGFGYRWVDNLGGDTATFFWEDIVGAPGAFELLDIRALDDNADTVTLSFNFPFYGVNRTTLYPSTNGAIGITKVTGFSNTCTLPTSTFPSGGILPFWDDLDTRAGGLGGVMATDSGSVWFKDEGTRAIIQWDSIGRSSGGAQFAYSFQAILYATGKIKLQYKSLARTGTTLPSGTIAIQQGSTAPNNNFLTYTCSTAASAAQDTIRNRAVWFYLSPPPTGRCCYLQGGIGTCGEFTNAECTTLGGQWGGAGTTCASSPCPTGRCCYAGGCATNMQLECTALGGTWTAGLNCTANPCPVPLPGGETCADAVAISVGGTYTGSTVGKLDDDPNLWCGSGSSNTAGDVWYTVIGNGNTLTVENCVASGGFDSQIAVYCGACGAFNCVGSSDDACGTQSRVTFCSSVGTTYYILVDGFSTAAGNYQLAVINGASCSTAINCRPQGRCCYVDNTGAPACADVFAEDCVTLGGEFNATLTCATPCPTGSCCYNVPGADLCHAPACVEGVYASQCATLGGVWTLNGTCSANCLWTEPCVCQCSTLPNSHSVIAASNTDYDILDNADVCLTINVPFQYHITDLNVSLDLVHTFDGDLVITLLSPMGTLDTLSNRRGSAGDNFTCTVFDDEATTTIALGAAPFTGSFIPDQALSAYDGQNAVGNWVLCVLDRAGGDVGYVIGACLTFEYDIILPAEFGGFSAVSRDGEVALNWNTLSERELANYEVSRDGSVIAVVEAQNSATGADYSFVDANVTNGTTYTYSLTVTDVLGGRQELATVEATPGSASVVSEYALHQNYPNPFNPTTNIAFDMVEAGHVSISVFNIMGQKVAELVNGNVEAGRHTVSFDAASLSSGLYLYKMEANGFTAQSKMVLMK